MMTSTTTNPKFTFFTGMMIDGLEYGSTCDSQDAEDAVEYVSPFEHELSLHLCHQTLSDAAWNEITQAAADAGYHEISTTDTDTMVGMSKETHESLLFSGECDSMKMNRDVRDFADIYAKSQGISAEKALSVFVTCGILNIIKDKRNFHQAINADGDIHTLGDIQKLKDKMADIPSFSDK